ncbi:hypothetical protein GCM10010520_60230 [Rhizobium viscosum]|uniref:Uncharacterized protein n=1 Tax=Rhizobium viscosum TaxID=1673 RepID=A0ABR9IUQ1_RHIVS|nr:hypothetical protein [Rhizobium viscosum]MBE1506913.1 hypothetical protein [Rhizobium viscosum]
MSQLQQKNMELITAVGRGDVRSLDEAEQMRLSQWAVMTAIVADYFHDKSQIFWTREERHAFGATRVISDQFIVWIGRYNGSKWEGYNHFGRGIQAVRGGQLHVTDIGIQSSAWHVLGALFIVGFKSARSTEPKFQTYLSLNRNMPTPEIFPTSKSITIPPAFNDEQTDELTRIPLKVSRDESRRMWDAAPE